MPMVTERAPEAPGTPPAHDRRCGRFLTLFLGDEEYGVELMKVQEILGQLRITRVPCLPRQVRGVANLRGTVIPLIDLRIAFGMDAADEDRFAVVVLRRGDRPFGILVDRVQDVVEIRAEEVEDVPSIGEASQARLLLGVAKSEKRVRLLLDAEAIAEAVMNGAGSAAA